MAGKKDPLHAASAGKKISTILKTYKFFQFSYAEPRRTQSYQNLSSSVLEHFL